MLTWDQICAIEPMLLDLERDAKLLGPDARYEGYEKMKGRMKFYVGWSATKPEIASSEAWDIAIQNIAYHCAP